MLYFVVFFNFTFNLKVSTNVSINVHGVKTSSTTIKEMCEHFDIIMIQEHWLYPDELSYLSMLSNDFSSFGLYPMPVGVTLLIGYEPADLTVHPPPKRSRVG